MERALVGPAGEHYVLYRLYRQGILASLAPPGTPTVDVLILDADGDSVVATVQVKTRTFGADGGWHMSAKHEDLVADRMFYAFVDLQPDLPATYIIPSTVVADVVSRSHKAWLATPGRGGRPHQETKMRRILPTYPWEVPEYPSEWLTGWLERWDLLREGASGTL